MEITEFLRFGLFIVLFLFTGKFDNGGQSVQAGAPQPQTFSAHFTEMINGYKAPGVFTHAGIGSLSFS